MTWVSVQICSFCWFQANGHQKPVRVIGAEQEQCFDCGCWTKGGIYVRRPGRTGEEDE